MYSDTRGLSGSWTDFFQGQWNLISSFWIDKYEKAKAQLMAYVGDFLKQRQVIMGMKERIGKLLQKADRLGDAKLRATAMNLQTQADGIWGDQLSLEGKVQGVMKKIGMVEEAKAAGQGVGVDPVVTPTVIITIAGAVAVVAGLVAMHMKKVAYLNRLLTDVENKVLTPQEAAELGKGSGGFDLNILGNAGPYILGAGAVVAVLYFLGKRR